MFSGGSVCGKIQTGGKWAASLGVQRLQEKFAQQPVGLPASPNGNVVETRGETQFHLSTSML